MTSERRLEGRVAIVTGAGRGLGRSHALALAANGAVVVVNDLGVDVTGRPTASDPARSVVQEIVSNGGRAIASGHDVSDWKQADELIQLAVREFGDLHVLINNAGILRDRSLHNLSEEEWDLVIRVHLKGHAAMTRHAFAYWRRRAKDGFRADRSVVMTTSVSGLSGNFGQANYASAKAAVLALSAVTSIEGSAFGVRSNVVSPGAKTRMALAVPGAEAAYASYESEHPGSGFDAMDPANVSGLIVWLSEDCCPADRQVLHLCGDRLMISSMPQPIHELSANNQPWTPDLLDQHLASHLIEPTPIERWNGFPEGFFQKPSAAPADALHLPTQR